jgi:two-component sensor histidine kinase
MCPRDKQVFIDAPPSPVRVTPDQAHNLALVINELATNTIQHTLPGRSTARISVRIALEDDGLASHAIGLASHAVLFEYRDDGPGYPEDVLQLERHAVGFDLIQNLTRQSLRGELSLHNDEGAVAVIRFPAQA